MAKATKALMARPDTIRKALEALEKKKAKGVEHVYNAQDCKKDDERCRETLKRLLS